MLRTPFRALLALVLVLPGAVEAQQKLSAAQPTTSTELRHVIPDATGSGPLHFGTAPYNISTASGIDCSGATDVSAAFLTAITAYSSIYIPLNCTILLDTVELPAVLTIAGAGPTSIIKHKNSATGHMLAVRTAGAFLDISGVTIDGNFQNNGGDNHQVYASLRLYEGGASASSPTIVRLHNMSFINGGYSDVTTFYPGPAGPVYWYENDTYHGPGADGYGAGTFTGAVDAVLNNVVIVSRQPTSVTDIGRGGYAFFRYTVAPGLDSEKHNVKASNIQCRFVGISSAASIGCIDGYHAGGAFQVTNSASLDAIGRGFITKSDSRNVLIEGNVVTNLGGNPNNPSAGAVVACYAFHATSATDVGGNYNISNNSCYNSANDGIVVYADFDTTDIAKTGIISGNIIDGCGTNRRGINLLDVAELKVSNNIVKNCDVPLFADAPGVLPIGPLLITGNQFFGAGKPGFVPVALTSNLWYDNNWQETSFSAPNLWLSVTGGAVTAWNPTILVNTQSAAQTVTTINNVPHGAIVTVRASSASNILTLDTGGNLGINNPIVIKDATSTVVFKSVLGTLLPISGVTQGLQPFMTAAGALSIRPPDGSTANGNASGVGAINLQIGDGTAATQVPSGTNAVAIGSGNTASSGNAVAIGNGNTVSGNTATAVGQLNSASGFLSMVLGARANDQGRNRYVAIAGTRFINPGDQQIGFTILGASTTSTTAARLTTDQTAAGSANTMNLTNNQSISYEIVIDVRDRTTGDEVTYVGVTNSLQRCKTKRGNNASLTEMVGTCTLTPLSTPGGTLAGLTAPTVTADTTNGGLNVSFTNVTSNLTHVAASIRALEVQ